MLIAEFKAKQTENTNSDTVLVMERPWAEEFVVCFEGHDLHDGAADFVTKDLGEALRRAALEIEMILDGKV
jgi:hypothetical protein